MSQRVDVDEVIRQALADEDAAALDLPATTGVVAELAGVLRGRMRWFGAMFMGMVLLFFGLSVYCGWRFLTAGDDAGLIRWGVGLLFCTVVTLNGKTWYWMETSRLASVREVKRVELLIAQLVTEWRDRGAA